MGCIQSKKDLNDINPNMFRVINIDDDNVDLSSGMLEISRLELTLYRKDKEPTRWPLKCLRRYGYDADVFTFEAGRRGPDGQGIYAFRCRRAETLFHTLQNYIQNRTYNPVDNTDVFSVSTNTNGPVVVNIAQNTHLRLNGTINLNQPVAQTDNCINNLSPNGTVNSMSSQSQSADNLITDGNYLEPMPNRLVSSTCFSSGTRLNSISNGPLSPDLISPSSPSSITNILEVTPLNSIPNKSNHFGVSNLYQDIPIREHNNNKPSLDIPPIEHAPTDPFTKMNISLNLEKQMPPSKQFPGSPNEDNLEGLPMYMNVTPGEFQPLIKSSNIIATTPSMNDTNSPQLATPVLTSTMFGFNRLNMFSADPNRSYIVYENLDPVDVKPLLIRSRFTKPDIFGTSEYQFLPIVDNSEPCSPTNSSRKVNYIVLDLDQQSNLNSSYMLPNNLSIGHVTNINNNVTTNVTNINVPTSHCMLPPESPKKASLGYATIDFNKTVALSNSTTPSSELDSEGSRKTRHNSTAAAPNTRHSNSTSD